MGLQKEAYPRIVKMMEDPSSKECREAIQMAMERFLGYLIKRKVGVYFIECATI